ncbi:MAG: hypothetical protein IPK83_12865 [Planctomycetes bacterium]|nr:hypothetical protein [Planctomycetota bacterium]
MKVNDFSFRGRRAGRDAAMIGVLLVGSCATVSQASSVVAMSISTMADHAGQVIMGEVTSTRSYWAQNPKRIETEVTFAGVQYLKGRHSSATDTFTLVVPGGSIGRTSMRICCAPEFKVGERRILFLLPQYRTFPTVGLDQGAFQIIRDAEGIDRVYQSATTPVVGFDRDTFAVHGGRSARDVHQHLIDANGAIVRTVETEFTELPAIALGDFLKVVQPILDSSTDHQMKEPAGRRILVELIATTLKAAPGASTAAQPQSAVAPSQGRVAKQIVRTLDESTPRDTQKPVNETRQGGAQ